MDKNYETLILRFLEGRTTENEFDRLIEWLNGNDENKKEFFTAKELWESSSLNSEELLRIEARQWEKIRLRIHSGKSNPVLRPWKIKIPGILKVAAVVLLALVAGWVGGTLYSKYNRNQFAGEMVKIATTKGQIKEVILADGTHVWLNSDSQLEFLSQFTSGSRKVKLSGEAYFDVVSDINSPFEVTTNNHKVRVLGTKFNVSEYPGSRIIETTLAEGKVQVLTGNMIFDLLPGQKFWADNETTETRVGQADLDVYTAWIEGRYEFRDEPLEKIMTIVERWWDIKTIYPKEMANFRFSGVLKRHKPLTHLLEVINFMQPISYSINDNEIIITKKT